MVKSDGEVFRGRDTFPHNRTLITRYENGVEWKRKDMNGLGEGSDYGVGSDRVPSKCISCCRK